MLIEKFKELESHFDEISQEVDQVEQLNQTSRSSFLSVVAASQ